MALPEVLFQRPDTSPKDAVIIQSIFRSSFLGVGGGGRGVYTSDFFLNFRGTVSFLVARYANLEGSFYLRARVEYYSGISIENNTGNSLCYTHFGSNN